MKEIIEIDEGFDAFKKSPGGGFTARSCPSNGELSYEKRFWKWIQETPKWTMIFSQWEDVDHLKCVVHWARQRGCFDSFCEYFGKEVMLGEQKYHAGLDMHRSNAPRDPDDDEGDLHLSLNLSQSLSRRVLEFILTRCRMHHHVFTCAGTLQALLRRDFTGGG